MSRFAETLLPARLGRDFHRHVAAVWVSNIGDGISLAAAPLLVASQTHDPLLVAMAPLLQQLPWLLFGLYAGGVADRVDRRRIMLLGNLVRVALVGVLVTFLVTGSVSIQLILGVVFLFGVAEVFADSVGSTYTPMLVAKPDLGIANSRTMAGYLTMNQLVGPPVGAALFAVGMAWPFVTQIVCLLLAVMIWSRVRLPKHEREGVVETHVWHDIVEGARWLWSHDAIRTLALVIVLFNVTWGAAWSVLVLYATRHLGMSEVGFGFLTTAGAVGGMLGVASYGWLEKHVSLGLLMKGCLLLECVVHFAFALNPWRWGAMVLMFVFGAYAFVWGTLSNTVRQRSVPPEFQGRVASVYMVGVFGGIVVGSLIGGLIAREWGPTGPFWYAGVGSVVILAFLWRSLDLIVHADEEALAADSAETSVVE